MQHIDPLDQLAALGIKVAWVTGLGDEIAYEADLRVVMADPDLCRREIARQTFDLLRDRGPHWPDDLADAS